MTTPETTNETLVRQDYMYGFVTAIEADTMPPGQTNAKSPDGGLEAWHRPQEKRTP